MKILRFIYVYKFQSKSNVNFNICANG